MKKKTIIRTGIAALTGAVILCAGAFFMTHIAVDGTFFPKDALIFDLTGHNLSVDEYQDLCARFPDRQILWTVPFQGSRLPMDTQTVTVTSLTSEDADSLDHLKNLKQVDGTHCTDYEALLYLQQRRPECQVLYQVSIGGESCSSLSSELTVSDATAEELESALPLLPRLRTLTLEGNLPKPEALAQLQTAFPEVNMQYTLDVGGKVLSSDARSLDLAAADVTRQELEHVLPLFRNAEELILTDTGLTDTELKALARQFPDIFFLCTMEFAGKPFSTDSTEIDISKCSITVDEVEALLPFFPKLKQLDMSYCGIEDEAMDALNRRYPDIDILWTLQIGLVTLRTDAIYFFPAAINEMNLPSNEELKKLRYCTEMIAIDIGHSKATECDWLEYTPHVKYLILADTKITDLTPLSNLKELIYLELFSMDLHDYSPLLECAALQDLNISSTYADPEPITKMTWLHNLMWNFVMEDPVLAEKAVLLEEQLPDTNVTIQTWRNIGGLWRHIPNYYVFRDIIGGDFFNQTHTTTYWGNSDANRILSCDGGNPRFAGELLRDIVRFRIDNGLPIPGIKNVGSEKAEILYQSLCEACE